jgi:hypothetical protein
VSLAYVPLLSVQRDLYRIPRGFERFRTYLATMIDPETRDLRLPLISMNPMGKEHVAALVDAYIDLEADAVAARAVLEAQERLADSTGSFNVTLVIADDARGGWTNRHTTEFGHRFGSKPYFKRGWITGLLWTSDVPSVHAVRDEVLTSVYRAAYIQEHGFAKTLREMLAQEGYAMALADRAMPALGAQELECTRTLIAPHAEASDLPSIVACFFGDEAARSLGFEQLGLKENAGLALALHDARIVR